MIESGILAAIGISTAGVIVCMVLHLIGRAILRPQDARQADLDALTIATLQAGTPTEDVIRHLRRAPRDLSRRALVHALKALGDAHIVSVAAIYDQLGLAPHALRALTSMRWSRRAEAALELGAFKRREAGPECLRMLQDRRPEVRTAASRALSDLGASETVRAVFDVIPVATRWAISDAVELIHGFGEAAVPELHAMVTTKDTKRQARLAAIEALGELAHAGSINLLRSLFAEDDVEIRATAARALGRIGGADVVASLGSALKDIAWEVRAVAARALGHCDDPAALVHLRDALNDPSWWVRLNAAESLGSREAQGADALRDAGGGKDPAARDMAVQMLERLQLRGAP